MVPPPEHPLDNIKSCGEFDVESTCNQYHPEILHSFQLMRTAQLRLSRSVMVLNIVRKIFQKHPLLANSVVYGSLYVGAEFSQQLTTKKLMAKPGEEKDIDFKTLGRYLVVGSLINSNYLFAWYKWLDGKYPSTAKKVIAKKVVLDQFVMTPPLYVIFYVSMSVMEGKEDLLEECRAKFAKTFVTSCFFWIPAQIINFTYLPNSARVVYLGLCSFAWVNILIWIKRSKIGTEAE